MKSGKHQKPVSRLTTHFSGKKAQSSEETVVKEEKCNASWKWNFIRITNTHKRLRAMEDWSGEVCMMSHVLGLLLIRIMIKTLRYILVVFDKQIEVSLRVCMPKL